MELTARLDQHLRPHGRRVVSVRPLGGGACQDLFRLELRDDDGRVSPWVLRSDARSALPGSLDRRREYGVVRAAAAAGVRTPDARWFGADLVRQGADAYFLPWCDGVAIGAKVVRDPALAGARAGLVGEVAGQAARVHRLTPSQVALDLPGPEAGESAARWRLAGLRSAVDALPVARPDLALALRWLTSHAPAGERRTLVHGDLRTGNLLVSAQGLQALLDWEFAHWGSPAEDLGWLCVRDWRFGAITLAAGGFATRAALYDAYEAASGVSVDAEAVHFWEVLGNVTWAAGALQQTERYRAGATDFELLAIGRRAAEMTWEALRLIDRGVLV